MTLSLLNRKIYRAEIFKEYSPPPRVRGYLLGVTCRMSHVIFLLNFFFLLLDKVFFSLFCEKQNLVGI